MGDGGWMIHWTFGGRWMDGGKGVELSESRVVKGLGWVGLGGHW